MLKIKNARDLDGKACELSVPSRAEEVIDAEGRLLIPALIDPHVHLRTPGLNHKETPAAAAQAALRSGFTTLCDMPNTIPSCTTLERLLAKKELLKAAAPVTVHHYLGITRETLPEMERCKDEAVAFKLFMGSSTGELLVDDDPSREAVFREAAKVGLPVAIHGEEETMLKEVRASRTWSSYVEHMQMRAREAAIIAVEKAVKFAEKYGAHLHVLHMTAREEVGIIAAAKKRGVHVTAEVCPHHLFLDESAYAELGGRAVCNPPIREKADSVALFQALLDGTIDCIGTDHAPHTKEEKAKPYPTCPSGVPGLETALPLMLKAFHEGKISLKKIFEVMHTAPRRIFNLPAKEDYLLIDLDEEWQLQEEDLFTHCGWSPFTGWKFKGKVHYVIANGVSLDLRTALRHS